MASWVNLNLRCPCRCGRGHAGWPVFKAVVATSAEATSLRLKRLGERLDLE